MLILLLSFPNQKRRNVLHRRHSLKKGVLRNFAKLIAKHLCQSLFFNKIAGLRPATLLKKTLWQRCFPVNVPKILRTAFPQNTSRRLLLFLTKIKLKIVFSSANMSTTNYHLSLIADLYFPPLFIVMKPYLQPKFIQRFPLLIPKHMVKELY